MPEVMRSPQTALPCVPIMRGIVGGHFAYMAHPGGKDAPENFSGIFYKVHL